tara:strand:- start:771 stop:1310 length:540 start_codon:yes stop_codon:yes gene_type:complete
VEKSYSKIMEVDLAELKLSEKLLKMYEEFLLYVERESVEFKRDQSKKLEEQLNKKILWLKSYITHLENCGEKLKEGSDYWAQHEKHELIIKYFENEYIENKKDILYLWCITCSDIVSSQAKNSFEIKKFNKYKTHLEHKIKAIRKNKKTIYLTCNDCSEKNNENTIIFCSEVSEWFDSI